MKLIVDCVLSHQLSDLQGNSALARLLSAATKITQVDYPLEALVCKQYGLQAKPDFPAAAISAAIDLQSHLSSYWLRADPVHLVMQRDCFSMGETIPLSVQSDHTAQLVDKFNEHFNQDGLKFFIGKSGAWYVQLPQDQDIKTTFPSAVVGKNIHTFLPEGNMAARWRSILNQTQMLLHEHPVNVARESAGQLTINSLWFSGGGKIPERVNFLVPQAEICPTLMFAESIFYHGLASWTGTTAEFIPDNLHGLLIKSSAHSCVRLQLPVLADLDETWFNDLLLALKDKKISQLVLNFGFYEKSVLVEIKPLDIYLDIYKFWRKTKPVARYLS